MPRLFHLTFSARLAVPARPLQQPSHRGLGAVVAEREDSDGEVGISIGVRHLELRQMPQCQGVSFFGDPPKWHRFPFGCPLKPPTKGYPQKRHPNTPKYVSSTMGTRKELVFPLVFLHYPKQGTSKKDSPCLWFMEML